MSDPITKVLLQKERYDIAWALQAAGDDSNNPKLLGLHIDANEPFIACTNGFVLNVVPKPDNFADIETGVYRVFMCKPYIVLEKIDDAEILPIKEMVLKQPLGKGKILLNATFLRCITDGMVGNVLITVGEKDQPTFVQTYGDDNTRFSMIMPRHEERPIAYSPFRTSDK